MCIEGTLILKQVSFICSTASKNKTHILIVCVIVHLVRSVKKKKKNRILPHSSLDILPYWGVGGAGRCAQG